MLDTSPYSDDIHIKTLQENGAVVLRNKDNNGVFDVDLTQNMKNIANKVGVEYDVKDETLEAAGIKSMGSTELGKLISNSEGMTTGTTLQIPTSEYHTNRESASIKSVINMIEILKYYLK